MPSPTIIHFVLCDHGKHGLAWAEREPKGMSREETIRDIKHGQLENVRQVLEVNLSANPIMSRDVTAEILQAVEDDIEVTEERCSINRRPYFCARDYNGNVGIGMSAALAVDDCRREARESA